MQIVEPKCDRQAVVACKHALDAGAFSALLEQFSIVYLPSITSFAGKSCPYPGLQRNGPSFPALSSRAGYLLVKIASLWIIKDLSTDNDRTAHGQESKSASQHPDHCRLPIPAFFISQRHNSQHGRATCGAPRRCSTAISRLARAPAAFGC